MSNLSDLLKDVTSSDNEAISLVGDSLGALADVGGGIGAVSDLINLFIPKQQQDLSEIKAKLDNIQKTINDTFAQLQQLQGEQRAEHILDRLRSFDPGLARAQSVLDALSATVQAQPPATEEFRVGQIELCAQSADELEGLANDDKWKTVFQDEIYYGQDHSDGFAGIMAPTADADGLVFSDRYILPFFMTTLNIFMAVAAALEPDYQVKFRDALRRYTGRLQKTHDISRDGIVAMRRPTQDEVNSNGWAQDWYGLGGQAPGDVRPAYSPYGVVHIYSGFQSLVFFPPPVHSFAEVTVKLNFAIRREWNKTYVAIGLRVLRNTIEKLRRLTGDPPLPDFDPSAWWSLRETFDFLGTFAPRTVSGAPDFSAFRIISSLAKLGGLSGQRPVSWRDSLNATLAASTAPFSPSSLLEIPGLREGAHLP